MKNEILSPVGSPETLEAAIFGGADAVYLGGKVFNARMNAKNFDINDIKEAVNKCHKNGVRLYVTLNTLIYDRQMKEALEYAASLYKVGVDALITADLGFSSELHKTIPDFELHASTQVSGHNVKSAEYLASLGFTRMVCARELSKENIKILTQNSPIEIEAFIHGAMCVCQSGQCLMSSFIGGRSGNRGECAQPCRLPYNNGYPLSLKDMCLAQNIKELSELGLASLKIEGRMKSPDYVYSVTSTYRKLIDEKRNATDSEIKKLADVFSRGGFSNGYFTSRINGEMLGVRSDFDKNNTRKSNIKIVDIVRNRNQISESERTKEIPKPNIEKRESGNIKKQNTARFYNNNEIPDTDFFDIVYLPLDRFCKGKANGVILPPVIPDSEYACIERKLQEAKQNGACHVLVGNIGHIELAEKSGLILHGDYRLNIYNDLSARLYDDFCDYILSPELSLPQIRDICGDKAVVVYGKIPLMTLERRVGTKALTDRRKVSFPVLREGGRDIVFNSVPVYMADKDGELKQAKIFNRHFIFTTEKKTEVVEIIKAYQSKKSTNKPIKRIK